MRTDLVRCVAKCQAVNTSARLLKLLSLLQARPSWPGPELAERLAVTTRTLRRDVSRLRELGYPVEAVSGRFGGYELAPGGALPPLLLDDDEAVAVALGLRAAAGGSVPGFEDAALAALSKIDQVLPGRLRERVAALEAATVRLGREGPPGEPLDTSVLVTLAQATRGPERVRFRYVDSASNTTDRHVEPFQIVRAARRWYLVARDRDRDAWRTFRVDRMSDVARTGMRFVHLDPPDAAAFVSEGLAVSAYAWQAKVTLDLTVEEARRMVAPTIGVIEHSDDATVLRIGADDLDWIARYLASLPCGFRVIEPDDLRHSVARLATQLAASG